MNMFKVSANCMKSMLLLSEMDLPFISTLSEHDLVYFLCSENYILIGDYYDLKRLYESPDKKLYKMLIIAGYSEEKAIRAIHPSVKWFN